VTGPAASEASRAVVSVTGLSHWFGEGHLRKQVLSSIDLTIKETEIVILTGPSGSGKTTLLTLIGALRTPRCGSLQVLGRQLVGATSDELTELRRQIGYIFQAHNLLRFLTARQNVYMSLELHPELTREHIDARTRNVLRAVGLEEQMEKYPEQLSGGQRQRVAVARALAGRPRLLLADEPTAALDKRAGRDVVTLMQSLAREQGCSILLVTHDTRILDIADRVVYLEDGCLHRDTDACPRAPS
jgi:putative ABC transport system ATP-binding protein